MGPAKQTALVSGASGNIGSHLCSRLQQLGWRVIGLSSKSAGAGPWHRYVAADITGPDVASRIAAELGGESVSVIWHLAGKAHALSELNADPLEYERANVVGTMSMTNLARLLGVSRIVLASSVKAMGEGGYEILSENDACLPSTAYGQSKLAAERVVLQSGTGVEAVVLRFCMVYGGTDRGNMGRLVSAVRSRRFPPFPETGNRRSFVYIKDAVQACVLAGTAAAAAGEVFLVTDGRLYSTRQLYQEACRAVGRPVPRFAIPLWILRLLARIGDGIGYIARRRAPLDTQTLAKLTESAAYSSQKIQAKIGYRPEWSLEHGLRDTARVT